MESGEDRAVAAFPRLQHHGSRLASSKGRGWCQPLHWSRLSWKRERGRRPCTLRGYQGAFGLALTYRPASLQRQCGGSLNRQWSARSHRHFEERSLAAGCFVAERRCILHGEPFCVPFPSRPLPCRQPASPHCASPGSYGTLGCYPPHVN